MKTLKNLFIYMFSLTALVLGSSCETEETSYAFQDVSAPTNLAIAFDMAQDDSGTVTVTPSADGATAFEIFFGDVEDETPVQIAPGESADHVYAEGSYEMKVIAVGITGLTSSLTKVVDVSFSKPENLVLDIQTTNLTANITPSADNAMEFEVYFGEVLGEEPVVVGNGGTANYTYAAEGSYTVRVVAKGASSQTSETSIVLTMAISGGEVLGLPLNFESETLDYSGFFGFGGAGVAVIDNPDMSGANTSAKVIEVPKAAGAEVWAGIKMELPEPINFTESTEMTINVWSPRAGVPVLLKLEDTNSEPDANGNPSVFVEVWGTTTRANAWETILFDVSTSENLPYDAAVGYNAVVVFPDFGTPGQDETFYFDDFQLGKVLPALPITFESTGVELGWSPFETSVAIVENPQVDADNPSATVLEMIKDADKPFWGGALVLLKEGMDLTNSATISVKIWSSRANTPFTVEIEDSSTIEGCCPTVFVVKRATTQTSGTWETFTFDFSDDPTFDLANVYDRVVIRPFSNEDQSNTTEAVTFYVDDIQIVQ